MYKTIKIINIVIISMLLGAIGALYLQNKLNNKYKNNNIDKNHIFIIEKGKNKKEISYLLLINDASFELRMIPKKGLFELKDLNNTRVCKK